MYASLTHPCPPSLYSPSSHNLPTPARDKRGVSDKVASECKFLKVLMTRLSGDGSLKEGDSVKLTCTVYCAHSSTQFVWFKNGQRLNQSDSVLHLPALTVGDSGNYSCALKTNETIRSDIISVNVQGVRYSEPICAVRGSTVSISCTYSYPPSESEMIRDLWCSMNSNHGLCKTGPYVYDSNSGASGHFQYVGDRKSNCTLLIRDVQIRHSGEYMFRFITNNNTDQYTGDPGVKLEVSDLKVLMIRLSGNGTLKEGDSVKLTCTVNCTHSSPQFVWFRNGQRLPESDSVLHLPALSVRDSGNYSCALKTDETIRSEIISLNLNHVSSKLNITLISGLILVIPVAIIYTVRCICTDQHEDDIWSTVIFSPVTLN